MDDYEKKLDEQRQETPKKDDHQKKLDDQRQEIIRQYEVITQEQNEAITRQAIKTQEFEQYKKNVLVQVQKDKAEKEKARKEKVEKENVQTKEKQAEVETGEKPSTSGQKKVKKGSLEDVLTPHALACLKKLKKEPVEEPEPNPEYVDEIDDTLNTQKIVTVTETKKETMVIIPKQIKAKGGSSKGEKVTSLRAGHTQPVPTQLQDKSRFYCPNCKAHYSRPDELKNHQLHNCCNEERQFICPTCAAAYYSEMSIREHYYKVHLETPLHYCTKCGEGFYHKSEKSTHA